MNSHGEQPGKKAVVEIIDSAQRKHSSPRDASPPPAKAPRGDGDAGTGLPVPAHQTKTNSSGDRTNTEALLHSHTVTVANNDRGKNASEKTLAARGQHDGDNEVFNEVTTPPSPNITAQLVSDLCLNPPNSGLLTSVLGRTLTLLDFSVMCRGNSLYFMYRCLHAWRV